MHSFYIIKHGLYKLTMCGNLIKDDVGSTLNNYVTNSKWQSYFQNKIVNDVPSFNIQNMNVPS